MALGAVVGLLLVSAALLGQYTPLQAQEETGSEAEGAPRNVAGVRISGLSGSLTYGGRDSFTVEAFNLTTVLAYDVIVSRNTSSLGIGACGTASQSRSVTGVASQRLTFTVHGCAAGSGTVTAVVRRSGLTTNEGAASQTVTVTATAPAAPARPTAPNPKARAFTARWQAPTETGGTALTGFRVVMRANGASWPGDNSSAVRKVGASARSYTFSGLSPNRIYWFKVKACNGANQTRCSGWSSQASVTLPIDNPGTPRWGSFSADATQIRVTWSAPSDTGGVGLTGYGLRHWRVGASEPSSAQAVVNAQTTSRTFSGLASDTSYRFSIQACNGPNRCSGWTNKDGRTNPTPTPSPSPSPSPSPAPGAPTAPHSIVSDQVGANSFRVQWSPHETTGGRALTGFGILVRQSGSAWDESQTVWVDKNPPHRHNVTGREAGTTYVVKIKSCNGSDGRSSCSAWSSDHRVTTTTVETNPGTRPVAANAVTAECPYTEKAEATWGKLEGFDVTPLEQQLITLCWTPVTGASEYTVSVTHEPTATKPSFRTIRTVTGGATSKTAILIDLIDLSRVPAAGMRPISTPPPTPTPVPDGLAKYDALGFKVTVTRSSPAASYDSDMIIVIDSPITQATTKSQARGDVRVTWNSVASLLGTSYDNGEYDIRYRKSSGDSSRSAASAGYFGTPGTPDPEVSSPHTIDALTPDAVYGIQLVYRNAGPSGNTNIFAARHAYAWVSDQPPTNGTALAGVPVTSRVIGTTFRYKICTSMFNVDGRTASWVQLITKAFDQWQNAVTADLITIEPSIYPCIDYREVAKVIFARHLETLSRTEFSSYTEEQIISYIEDLIITSDQQQIGPLKVSGIAEHIADLQRSDKSDNEIKMFLRC